MNQENQYFIVKKKAVPEVLLKVVEAKHLLDSGKAATIQEAADSLGLSRSSFYKYKDDIFPFHDSARGMNFTFMLKMEDKPGLLSKVLNKVAEKGANILTIHQTIPVNEVALVTITAEIPPSCSESVSELLVVLEQLEGIHNLKILARE